MRRHASRLLLTAALSLGFLTACGDDGGRDDADTTTTTDTTTTGSDTTVAGGAATDSTATDGPGEDGGDGGDSEGAASDPLVTEYCDQVAAYVESATAYAEDPGSVDVDDIRAQFDAATEALAELNTVVEDLTPADSAQLRACAEDLVAAPVP